MWKPGTSFCPNAYSATAIATSRNPSEIILIERSLVAPRATASTNTITYVNARLNSRHVPSGATLQSRVIALQIANPANSAIPATASLGAESRSVPLHSQAPPVPAATSASATCSRASAPDPAAPCEKAA